MAQWKIIENMVKDNQIREEDLHRIYVKRMNFSILFRGKFATWIESQDWDTFAKSENIEEVGRMKFAELLELMKKDLETLSIVNRLALLPSVEEFENHYDNNPGEFIWLIQSLLKNEAILIHSTQEDMGVDKHFDVATENTKITTERKKLETQLRATDQQLRQFERSLAKKIVQGQEIQGKLASLKKKSQSDCQEAKQLETEIHKITSDLREMRKNALQSVCDVCDQMTALLEMSWKDLEDWKDDQRLACTMLRKPKEGIMGVLDAMFEDVAQTFHKVLDQVDRLVTQLNQLHQLDDCLVKAKEYSDKMDEYLREHLKRVFVVDKNVPKQVLKVTKGKSLGFCMSVRLLGGYALGVNANKPKVYVRLYQEKALNDVLYTDQDVPSVCTIQNTQEKPFQFIREGNCLASFDHMTISGMKREGKGRNDEFVTDQKHAFVFFTTVKIQEQTFKLKAMSLPIVITSQTSQECMARGTIIWSSAFLKPKDKRRSEFDAEEEVKWISFADVINALFKGYTRRELTPEKLQYLASKAFRAEESYKFNKMSISQKAIFKDKIQGCEFPFWKWLMACLNSVKNTVSCEWREGLIYGFISKKNAEEILRDKSPGTFLIRFSESSIEEGQRSEIHGYLTVAFNELHPEKGVYTVFHTKESLSPKDLTEKGLAPILDAYQIPDHSIHEYSSKKLLRYLWTPEKCYDFEEVFGKFVKEKEKKNDGYKRGKYVVEIYLTDTHPSRSASLRMMSPSSSTVASSPAVSDFSEVLSPISLLNQCMSQQCPSQQQQEQQQQQQQVLLNSQHNCSQPIATVNPMQFGLNSCNNDEMMRLVDQLMDSNIIVAEDGDIMLSTNTTNSMPE